MRSDMFDAYLYGIWEVEDDMHDKTEKKWTKENPHVYISSAHDSDFYREVMNSMRPYRKPIYKPYVDPMEIKDVIFNDPATIVFWADGTKTVVKRQEGDEFDPEKGLTMAIVKKIYGNKGSYCNKIKKWTEPYYEKQAKKKEGLLTKTMLDSLCEAAKKALAGYAAYSVAGDAIARSKKLDEKKVEEEKKTGVFYKYDDPIFETREDAEKCLDILKELIGTYGCATVADMYEASGVDVDIFYTMNKYGWTNLNHSKIHRVRNGYVIDLPKASLIDFNEKSDS